MKIRLIKYAIKTQMLKSPEQVQSILDNVYIEGYYKQINRSIRDKLVFWLLYCGMEVKELQLLKKTDINYSKKTIINPIDKDIQHDIDDNIMSLWKMFSEIDFIEKLGGRHGLDIMSYKLDDSEYLFRPIAGKNPDIGRRFTHVFSYNKQYI